MPQRGTDGMDGIANYKSEESARDSVMRTAQKTEMNKAIVTFIQENMYEKDWTGQLKLDSRRESYTKKI